MANGTKYWRRFSGQRLLNLIIAVSAIAISYEGMSQGIMGAVVVAPEFAVCTYLIHDLLCDHPLIRSSIA